MLGVLLFDLLDAMLEVFHHRWPSQKYLTQEDNNRNDQDSFTHRRIGHECATASSVRSVSKVFPILISHGFESWLSGFFLP